MFINNFIYLFTHSGKDYFHDLTSVNNAAMNIMFRYLSQLLFYFPLDKYPEMELLDHMIELFLIFEEPPSVFHCGSTKLHFQ